MEYHVIADELNELPTHTIGIGVLGNNRISHELIHKHCKNSIEFAIVDQTIMGYKDFFYSDSVDELVKSAYNNGNSHILIYKVGIVIDSFMERFDKWFNTVYRGEVFVGHVLDRGSAYWTIHPQMMLIDTEWFVHKVVSVAPPSDEPLTAVEPIRSEENFHDHYTPKWISAGTTQRTYTKREPGWNIVYEGLKDPRGIGIWPEELRSRYAYLYPETQEARAKVVDIHNTFSMQNVIYLTNTENFKLDYTPRTEAEEKHIILAPAGGLSAAFDAYSRFGYPVKRLKYGWEKQKDFRKYCSIVIYDKSSLAIKYQTHLHKEWDPHKETMLQFQDRVMPRDSAQGMMRDICRGQQNMDQFSAYIDEHTHFKDWYNAVYKNLKHNFVHVDLFDIMRFRRMIQRYVVKDPHNNGVRKIFVHFNFSNILQYNPTAFFWDFEDRAWFRKEMIQVCLDIEKEYPNIYFNRDTKLFMGKRQYLNLEILPWINMENLQWQILLD